MIVLSKGETTSLAFGLFWAFKFFLCRVEGQRFRAQS